MGTESGRAVGRPLLRFPPGAHGDFHEHLGYELTLVLHGQLDHRDGRSFRRGDLVVEGPGSSHQMSSAGGCTVLAIRTKPPGVAAPSQRPQGWKSSCCENFVFAAFGRSGPSLARRLLDLLGLPAAVVPPAPGSLTAFGLLTLDVRNDYVQTTVSRARGPHLGRVAAYAALQAQAAAALAAEGFAPSARRFLRSADLRCYGQAFEVGRGHQTAQWTRRPRRRPGGSTTRPSGCTATASATILANRWSG